jgi:hypothetical protein
LIVASRHAEWQKTTFGTIGRLSDSDVT